MIHTAFDAQEVTGEVLLKHPNLMALWKWAADEGELEAIRLGGKNYVVVRDKDLAAKVQAAARLEAYRYDDEAGVLV